MRRPRPRRSGSSLAPIRTIRLKCAPSMRRRLRSKPDLRRPTRSMQRSSRRSREVSWRRGSRSSSAYCESGHTALGVSTLGAGPTRLAPFEPRNGSPILAPRKPSVARMDRARADFAEARKVIGRLSPYQGGDMIPVVDPVQSALSHLRLRMVEAGLIDALPDANDGQPEEFAITLAARRAELGDAGNALSALDAIRIEDGPGRDDLRQRLVLTRARVLRLLSRDEESEAEFARARRIALAQDGGPGGPSMRGYLLVRLAEERLRDKQPTRAKEALDEAQAVQLADLVRLGRRWMNGSGMASVARARAAAGDDAAAMSLIAGGSQQVKFRAIAVRAADRVNGEIAVAQARAGAASESVASLRNVEGSAMARLVSGASYRDCPGA